VDWILTFCSDIASTALLAYESHYTILQALWEAEYSVRKAITPGAHKKYVAWYVQLFQSIIYLISPSPILENYLEQYTKEKTRQNFIKLMEVSQCGLGQDFPTMSLPYHHNQEKFRCVARD